MNRTNLIQLIIDKINAQSYLEIGVADGKNFEKINCKNKVGVDPDIDSKATVLATSDEFFIKNKLNFDVIFIDGLHHSDQVTKDIYNSLNSLNENGYIICHDMNPIEEAHQIIPFTGGLWNGDCWKSFVSLRTTRDDLEMSVVDIDHGCAIIKKGHQKKLQINEEINFKNFAANRNEWLNLINWENFLKKYLDKSFDDIINEYTDKYLNRPFNNLLDEYIMDTENPDINYDLARHYESIDQTASALSFFLRCAERSRVPELRYECLIRASSCFEKQGKRNTTVRGLLQHAVSMLPKRPEAYYLLSRFYEIENKDESWQNSYMIASIGEKVADFNSSPLLNPVDYPGPYSIKFQKGVAAWWCGLCQESKDIFLNLLHEEPKIDENFVQPCVKNLQMMKTKSFLNYNKNNNNLKIKFNGHDLIKENFSEAFQDIFVLSLLNGKKNGTYLEIGAGHPIHGNNTFLLESVFDWSGAALDIDQNFVNSYNDIRKNKCFCKDAKLINYNKFLPGLGFSKTIDYLQIDCEPVEDTYQVLLTLPFDNYKFSIITYEHDYYCDATKSFQQKSTQYLESYGYVKVLNNISPDNHRSYEDWWIHPEIIEPENYEKLMKINDSVKNASKIFLGDKA